MRRRGRRRRREEGRREGEREREEMFAISHILQARASEKEAEILKSYQDKERCAYTNSACLLVYYMENIHVHVQVDTYTCIYMYMYLYIHVHTYM